MCLFLPALSRRIMDMGTDVKEQLTVVLKSSNSFSVALDESVDINNTPSLAIVARYCSNREIREELCRLKATDVWFY